KNGTGTLTLAGNTPKAIGGTLTVNGGTLTVRDGSGGIGLQSGSTVVQTGGRLNIVSSVTSGAVTVQNKGTVRLDNAASKLTAAVVLVNGGGTLSGTGLVQSTGALHVAADGILAPEAKLTVAALGGVTLADGAQFVVTLWGDGTGDIALNNSLLYVQDGEVHIEPDAMLRVTILHGFEPSIADIYTIIKSEQEITGMFPDQVLSNTMYRFDVVKTDMHTIALMNAKAIVPEPGTYALCQAVGVLALAVLAKRRRSKCSGQTESKKSS
ncbi:MAG: hypothetical protein LBV54_04450, partial [Puniceicoccales bacterium]|nr:hypothetical protein [Puniceicoccales bacterium]